MDNITTLPVRVLADFVLVRQTMVKKNRKIITDASKDLKDSFDYYFEILDRGAECKREFYVGESPIFSEYVKFNALSVIEKSERGMVSLVVVHENDIIAIDLAAKKLELTSIVAQS